MPSPIGANNFGAPGIKAVQENDPNAGGLQLGGLQQATPEMPQTHGIGAALLGGMGGGVGSFAPQGQFGPPSGMFAPPAFGIHGKPPIGLGNGDAPPTPPQAPQPPSGMGMPQAPLGMSGPTGIGAAIQGQHPPMPPQAQAPMQPSPMQHRMIRQHPQGFQRPEFQGNFTHNQNRGGMGGFNFGQ